MGNEKKLPLYGDAGAISKLTREPLEVKMGIFEVSEDGEEVKKVGDIPLFLHGLTWLERNHVRASYTEAYKFYLEQGGDLKDAREFVSAVIPRMTIYFALRCGVEKGSERFFKTQEELLAYPFDQAILDLYGEYVDKFTLTDKEWGNFQRARSSGTSSALPATSKPGRLAETTAN